MKNNVFLKSTLRQPVKMALLTLVLALITFAFVSRASEYLLIRQETDRLGGYYRAIGLLEGINSASQEDMSPALEYLAGNKFVQLAEQRRGVSALINDGFYNADTSLTSEYGSQDFFFYGTLRSVGTATAVFTPDAVLAGRPEYIAADGESLELELSESALKACDGMKKGERYLLRGRASAVNPRRTKLELVRLLPQSELWYDPVPPGQEADFHHPRLAGVESEIRKLHDNQRALYLIPTQDMSALPETYGSSPAVYLTEGRWFDGDDTAAGARVCVIHAGLAKLRNLSVGDTLTLTLRDIPSDFGYSEGAVDEQTPTWETSCEIIGFYEFTADFTETFIRSQVYVPSSLVPASFVHGAERTVSQLSFRIMVENQKGNMPAAGEVTFRLKRPEDAEDFLNGPAGELKELGYQVTLLETNWENFHQTTGPLRRSSLYNVCIYTLLLIVLLCLTAFLYFRSRWKEIAIARALGMPAGLCIREVTLPLLLIGLAGILAGGGSGWKNTLENAAVTLSSLSALGISEAAAAPAMPIYWLILLWAFEAAVLTALATGCACFLTHMPALALMQGGGAAVHPAKEAVQEETERVPPAPLPSAEARTAGPALPSNTSFHRTAAAALGFIQRHMIRSPVKSLLALALAAIFVTGLAAIHLAIENGAVKIDWLYQNTYVRMDLLPETASARAENGGFLFGDTIDAILGTGMMESCYLEGAADGLIITDVSLWNNDGTASVTKETAQRDGRSVMTSCKLFSFDDAEEFSSGAGSGAHMPITYCDGWDESLFAADWREAAARPGGDTAVIPVIIPRKWSADYMETAGGTEDLYGAGDMVILNCKNTLRLCRVAGVHGGFEDRVLIPNSALRALAGERMVYSRASFIVDPGQNRDLSAFREFIDGLANAPRIGSVPVNITVWDEELTQAVQPLKDSLELMQVLYPVVQVLSLLVAAGVSVLFALMSAKEAAILRVLGTPKRWTGFILSAQQIFVCIAGQLVGLIAVILYVSRAHPEFVDRIASEAVPCALLYLAAAIAGGALSAASVTARNPLELLQVRE